MELKFREMKDKIFELEVKNFELKRELDCLERNVKTLNEIILSNKDVMFNHHELLKTLSDEVLKLKSLEINKAVK